MPALILASTSTYRRALLERLGIAFSVAAPHTDETPHAGERPFDLAARLARAKALDVGAAQPGAVVIGADQVADLDGEPINKPETHARAVEQLRLLRGRRVVFHSALCLAQHDTARAVVEVVETQVRYRQFDDAQIERYLRAERPYDCAGSAKAEGLGIVLVESIRGDDPTALIGLPLIALTRLLPEFGIPVL
ncbi:MAG: septum formation protein Maf [Proteobacteria bacterium]|nr:septum formation protein Maf [Burkholderiales bacterium]